MKSEFVTPPILFIVFNRLQNTKIVFDKIRKAKPNRLYISSDGARKNVMGEAEKVNNVRNYILNSIDWECEVNTLFHTTNLGCKKAPHNAITWLFENEVKGIILEDDCVPSRSFFKYTSSLLEKYNNDLRVFGISGTNFQEHKFSLNESYYFSDFFMTWGWATWKSRWERHLTILKDFDIYIQDPLILKKIRNRSASTALLENARISVKGELDAWDYQWILSCYINNGLIATPKVNLITNIGFGEDATHTANNHVRSMKNKEMKFPLIHPKNMLVNQEIDDSFFKNIFGWMSFSEKITSFSYIKAFVNRRILKV